MKKTSCYGCAERTMTCHSNCKEYKDYSDELRKKRELEHKKRIEISTTEDYKKRQIAKCMKGRRKNDVY